MSLARVERRNVEIHMTHFSIQYRTCVRNRLVRSEVYAYSCKAPCVTRMVLYTRRRTASARKKEELRDEGPGREIVI